MTTGPTGARGTEVIGAAVAAHHVAPTGEASACRAMKHLICLMNTKTNRTGGN